MKFENKVIPEENYGKNVLNLYGIELASKWFNRYRGWETNLDLKNSPDDRGYGKFNRSAIGRVLK